MTFAGLILLILTVCNSEFSSAREQSVAEMVDQAQKYAREGKLDKGIEFINEALVEERIEKNKDLLLFQKAILQLEKGLFSEAEVNFRKLAEFSFSLEVYSRFYLGKIYAQQGQLNKAEKELQLVIDRNANLKLYIDATLLLGQMDLQQGRYELARNHFRKLEKRAKGTEQYPEVLYGLAEADLGSKKSTAACHYLRKLFISYPEFPAIVNWGPWLHESKLGDRDIQCVSSLEDFNDRLKSLMRTGSDARAKNEVDLVRSRIQSQSPFAADMILAQYYILEGEVAKAKSTLQAHLASQKNNIDFLTTYAVVAARGGDVQEAVGAYYLAYKNLGRGPRARQSLFQAAFMSYQFRDYDGATRKFKELLKAFPGSSLNKEIQWQLAWLRYLKGDFLGSFQELSKIHDKYFARKKTDSSAQRISYWRAMSLLRLGEIPLAKKIFKALSQDKLMGYYSLAAKARLTGLTKISQASENENSTDVKGNKLKNLGRLNMGEFFNSAIEEYKEAQESEESLAQDSQVQIKEVAESDPVQETGRSEVSNDFTETVVKTDFKDPALAFRFERARDLMILGQFDHAKWDLYEIERRTQNREYLRALIQEYFTMDQYHRSSYIAQTYFSKPRAELGMEGVRYLWEMVYPKAFADSVQKSAKEWAVPQELIWGIMRAESQYRRDAISPVGALGLMQVMPYTGLKLANLAGDKDFSAKDLFKPEIAIHLGGKYLQRLYRQMDGRLPLIAAAYNAGPHRVQSWIYSVGKMDMDEFIEHIPFLETRNYVKKVASNSWIYKSLYGEKGDFLLSLAEPVGLQFEQISTKENWEDI